jgi:hypothetical protein
MLFVDSRNMHIPNNTSSSDRWQRSFLFLFLPFSFFFNLEGRDRFDLDVPVCIGGRTSFCFDLDVPVCIGGRTSSCNEAKH